ncbi:MAG TPA: peptide chain release factor N(5)-glutamine methyltransferase [Gemmatimonadales bacterium]|nr:peptide chain release factor N(5)-glutamine methyltransferase [Gemmatimonadales bacterium]
MPELKTTVGRLLTEARTRLRDAGVDEAPREAARIWAGLLHLPTGEAWLARERQATPEEAARFLAAVERRAAGEPLAYVTGWTGFRRLTIRTDRRALIPRPETEGLVDLVLAKRRDGIAADVCTGTGCLALALADEGRFEAVHAVELDPDAHALATENIRSSGLRVRLHLGDLVTPLLGLGLDVLVSNPPYIAEEEYLALDPSVRDWEPRLALASGRDGLEHTRRLLDEGRAALRAGGLVALELDATRAGPSAELARTYGWTDIAVHRDLYGRERYLTARRG